MAVGYAVSLAKRAGALALVVALVPSVPAIAAPTGSSVSDAVTRTAEPTTPSRPAKPSGDSSKPTTTRKPATGGSEIDVNVDGTTAEFRSELAKRQQRLDEFMAQLDALDRELEVATEQYNASVDRLNQMKQQVQTARGDLDQTRNAYQMQEDILGSRAASMYRDGALATFEVLLDSRSVADFVARVKFLNTIGMRDADIVASLKGQKQLLESQVASLKNAESEANSLEFELKARQIEIMLRIQERQEMLSAAQTDLVTLLDAEAARRKTEESALLSEVLSGASDKGIVATAGSPVETALAYHGVPYLWGGETPRGFDCSGLVLYVFRQHGVELPHYSGSQFRLGDKVSPAQLQPADVVFFGSPIHHVGIYMGGGYYIHAPRTGDFVKISKLAARNDYAGARRYAWNLRVGPPKSAVTNTTDALSKVSR